MKLFKKLAAKFAAIQSARIAEHDVKARQAAAKGHFDLAAYHAGRAMCIANPCTDEGRGFEAMYSRYSDRAAAKQDRVLGL